MVRLCKAMIAEERILGAVSDIFNIKSRKGTASDDAVRVILKKWWIPADSKIANSLKWYSHVTAPDEDMAVTVIANHLVEISSIENSCRRYDIIHEVPSNGFNLPEGAGLILNKDLWFNDEGSLKVGKVDQISLDINSGCYDILITLMNDSKKSSNQSERNVFLNRADLELAVNHKFI